MTSDMPFVFVGCNARQSLSKPGQWGMLEHDSKLHWVILSPLNPCQAGQLAINKVTPM